MSWIRTDLVAVACILGGAAAGGAATLAMVDGSAHPQSGCAVESFAVAPSIAVSHNGHARAVIVTPDVQVRTRSHCDSEAHKVVEIHMERHMDQLEAKLEHLDEALAIEMESLERTIEAEVAAELEGLEVAIEAEMAQAEARAEMEEALQAIQEAAVKVKIQRAGGGK